MEFKHPVAIDPKTTFYLTTGDELHDLPTLLPIPGLFPAHRLSLILGTSGSGLTQLACHLASYLAPPPPPNLLPDNHLLNPPADPPHNLDHDPSAPPQSAIGNGQSAIDNAQSPITPPDDPDEDFNKDFEEALAEELAAPVFPSVLLISQRDSADVLKPRLQALGADLRRILILTEVTERRDVHGGISDEVIRPFQPKDHATLYQLLRENKGIGLVLIDNADWMFAATNHPSRAQIQRQLACLEAVADQREVAIVLLTAIPALNANPVANRLLQTLHDACRTVHLLAPDLQDPAARLLFTLKNTIATPSGTRRLHTLQPGYLNFPPFSPTDIAPSALSPSQLANGQPVVRGVLARTSPTAPSPLDTEQPATTTAAQSQTSIAPLVFLKGAIATYPHYLCLRHQAKTRGPAPHQHDFACEVLIDALRAGPLPTGQLKEPLPGTIAHHAQLANVSWGTICRAKKTLQIPATQTAAGWIWTLPPTISTLSLPPAIVEQKLHPETCASDPMNVAQTLIPPAPATLPTPSLDNLRLCPIPSPLTPQVSATASSTVTTEEATPTDSNPRAVVRHPQVPRPAENDEIQNPENPNQKISNPELPNAQI